MLVINHNLSNKNLVFVFIKFHKKNFFFINKNESGGESGIRTHGTFDSTHTFQACALDLSAISPKIRINFIHFYTILSSIMKNCTMYCISINKNDLDIIKKLKYIPVGLGNDEFSNEWVTDRTLENIASKNKFFGEYTFHYWFWKNLLPNIHKDKWIGFCTYRDY